MGAAPSASLTAISLTGCGLDMPGTIVPSRNNAAPAGTWTSGMVRSTSTSPAPAAWLMRPGLISTVISGAGAAFTVPANKAARTKQAARTLVFNSPPVRHRTNIVWLLRRLIRFGIRNPGALRHADCPKDCVLPC